MGIQKLFGIGVARPSQGATPLQPSRVGGDFVKNTFNFGTANPNQPNQIVAENNPLGLPSKGTRLYCLG